MRWTVKLVAEVEPGQCVEHDIASIDRDDRITPASLGLSLAEGKAVLAAIQAQLVADQVKRHGAVARHCRWCGRVQSSKGHYRSTFVRRGCVAGADAMTQALREHGVRPETRVTVLSDGDGGLRAIQRTALPEAEPVLDWFHIARRWQHLHQLATGADRHGLRAEDQRWLLDRIDRAKWALWHGHMPKARQRLWDLLEWCWNARVDPAWLRRLGTHISELTAYLNANADSLPNYGARYRAGQPISTGFAESAVNAIVAKRMIKRQQMRWNRDTVQPFLTVRVAVLNGTLEQTFRSWHAGFRPVESSSADSAA
jgi:hypothetical protein